MTDTLIYSGILPGLLQDLYLPVVKSNVTSRKFTIFRLVSQKRLSSTSFLNILMKSFLIQSAWVPLTFSEQANPLSLYIRLRFLPYLVLNMYKIQRPTNLQISAPPKLSIAPSKS